jgi:two-component system response regulator YesN
MEAPKEISVSEELLHWKTRVEKVKEYVSENPGGDLNITTVSEKFNLNKFTLQHIFRVQEQETYREYVERIRMEKALQLLKEGKWVNEVMDATGYKNRGTFNSAFKKRYGLSAKFFKK